MRNFLSLVFTLFATGALAQTTPDDSIAGSRRDGVLRVCVAESQPFTVKAPDGKWGGMNIDLANELAAALNTRLQIVDVTYATMIPALVGRQCSIIMAPAFATAERALSVVFTNVYNATGEVAVVRRNSSFQTAADLNRPNVTFAVLSGTTNERTAKTMFPQAQVRSFASDTQVAPLLEVANGRADANVGDLNSVNRFISANPNAALRILDEGKPLNRSLRAFMVRPGDWHFLAFVNTWISGLQNNGQMDVLAAKYGVQ
jgi:ABC-type amino acid transport substrate-binding protein